MSAYTHHGDCSTGDPCERCFEFGQTTEQKRIIKLLEELKGDQEGCCDECKPHLESSRNYLTAVIALIKGENNL